MKLLVHLFFKKMKKFAKTNSNKNLQKFEKNCFFSTSNLKDLDQKSEAKLKSEAKPNFYPPPFPKIDSACQHCQNCPRV